MEAAITMTTSPVVHNSQNRAQSNQTAKKVNILKAPEIAWPTIVLCTSVLGLWIAVVVTTLAGILNPWLALIINTPLAFALFTPMHDASHKSITRAKLPNEIMGRLCSIALMAPFTAFRYLHLQHHRHTNHDHEDPDMWSGRGPWYVLPLRWLTQDVHYYYFYFKRWSERPVAERRETLVALLGVIALVIAIGALTSPVAVLLAWVIPARFAIMALAYGFDYLPHKPHHITSKQDRYTATSVRPNPVLTPVLLYQNYHLVHHLYPGVPFYCYGKVWRSKEEQLRNKGAKVIE